MNTRRKQTKTAEPEDDPEPVHLLDGTLVCVRRLRPTDFEAILELHQRLTEREKFLRFFAAHPAHLDEFARHVTECRDGRCAVGAFEAGQLIGVANYALSDEPGVAEVAVAVDHETHLRGVATVLLKRLAEIASGNGLRFFVADILVENAAMLQVLSDAGWRHTSRWDGPVLDIRIDLADLNNPYARGAVNAI
jgi:RimJ/RimL family protein N-acetyltransferase